MYVSKLMSNELMTQYCMHISTKRALSVDMPRRATPRPKHAAEHTSGVVTAFTEQRGSPRHVYTERARSGEACARCKHGDLLLLVAK